MWTNRYMPGCVIFVTLFALYSHAKGPAYLADDPPPGLSGQPLPKLFILNRDGARVFEDATGNKQRQASTRLGELYFGCEETPERVLLGKYSYMDEKFTIMLGWVAKGDLLTGLRPLSVDEAVKKGYSIDVAAGGGEQGAFGAGNPLDLRVICKPENRLVAARSPELAANPAEKGFHFTWYYVYAFEETNGRSMVLVGDRSMLYDSPYVYETNLIDAETRLLGWVDAGAVQPWCSNVAFENNCLLESILERNGLDANGNKVRDAIPARMYAKAGNTQEWLAEERMEDYWEAFLKGDKEEGEFGAPDPVGLNPTVPRFLVVGKVDDDCYQVATLGDIAGGMDEGDISDLQDVLLGTLKNLQKVDVVFVIDATGSMCEEIEEVGKFLQSISAQIRGAAQQGHRLAVGERALEIDAALDINVGLVVYQDKGRSNQEYPFCTKVVFAGLPLASKEAEMDEAFRKLPEILNGGQVDGKSSEAVYDALGAALTSKESWREDSALRLIILVGDEPPADDYDIKVEQQRILASMPLPNLKERPDLEKQIADNEIEGKKEYTKIRALYTTQNGFPRFSDGLKELTSNPGRDIMLIANFENGGEEGDPARGKREFVARLLQEIELANAKVRERLEYAAEEIRKLPADARVDSGKRTMRMLMNEAALEIAARGAGTSIEELRRLNKVAFLRGFINLRQPGLQFPLYRRRVVLNRYDIIELRDVSDSVATSILRFREGLGGSPSGDRKIQIAKALVTAVRKVSGTSGGDMSDEKLYMLAKEILKEAEDGKKRNMRSFLSMRKALPISSEGILGMPVEKLLELSWDQIVNQASDLQRKSKCLARVLREEPAPEDYRGIDSFTTTVKTKKWAYVHPVSEEEFYYVPAQYLP